MEKLINRKLQGFTLIELMVVIAITVILLTLAVPSFDRLIRTARANAAAETFAVHFNLARTQALKGGVGDYVVIAPNGSNTTLEKGWSVFKTNSSSGDLGTIATAAATPSALNDAMIAHFEPAGVLRAVEVNPALGADADSNASKMIFDNKGRLVALSFRVATVDSGSSLAVKFSVGKNTPILRCVNIVRPGIVRDVNDCSV